MIDLIDQIILQEDTGSDLELSFSKASLVSEIMLNNSDSISSTRVSLTSCGSIGSPREGFLRNGRCFLRNLPDALGLY